MGQANRRGTFEERKKKAIAEGKIKEVKVGKAGSIPLGSSRETLFRTTVNKGSHSKKQNKGTRSAYADIPNETDLK